MPKRIFPTGASYQMVTRKKKGGSLVASPLHLIPHFLQNVGKRCYFATTGITCIGCPTDALFIPAPVPCSGNNR